MARTTGYAVPSKHIHHVRCYDCRLRLLPRHGHVPAVWRAARVADRRPKCGGRGGRERHGWWDRCAMSQCGNAAQVAQCGHAPAGTASAALVASPTSSGEAAAPPDAEPAAASASARSIRSAVGTPNHVTTSVQPSHTTVPRSIWAPGGRVSGRRGGQRATGARTWLRNVIVCAGSRTSLPSETQNREPSRACHAKSSQQTARPAAVHQFAHLQLRCDSRCRVAQLNAGSTRQARTCKWCARDAQAPAVVLCAPPRQLLPHVQQRKSYDAPPGLQRCRDASASLGAARVLHSLWHKGAYLHNSCLAGTAAVGALWPRLEHSLHQVARSGGACLQIPPADPCHQRLHASTTLRNSWHCRSHPPGSHGGGGVGMAMRWHARAAVRACTMRQVNVAAAQ